MKLKVPGKIPSLLIVFGVYILALTIAGWVIHSLETNSMIRVFIADVAATAAVFLFSLLFRNSSVYDPYWSVIPPFIAGYLISVNPEGNSTRQWIILGLILFWSVRLTANWARGWAGMSHQDWRYRKIAADTGIFYWPVSFLGIHLMPTLFVFAGCLPLWFSLESQAPFNGIDIIAALITFLAALIEWTADEQLRNFRKKNNEESYMDKGLWSRIRHPNYAGEILFWTGLFLFVLSSGRLQGWWTGVGFLSMLLLFKFISIPLMEKRNLARRPGYAHYMQKVYPLLPFRKK